MLPIYSFFHYIDVCDWIRYWKEMGAEPIHYWKENLNQNWNWSSVSPPSMLHTTQ